MSTLRCGPMVKPNILQVPPWKTHELRSYSVKDREILIVSVRIEELKLFPSTSCIFEYVDKFSGKRAFLDC